jgi:hypothetical protein
MLRTVRSEFYSTTSPPASTLLAIEGLPSLDASLGVDVVAIADYTRTVGAQAVLTAGR